MNLSSMLGNLNQLFHYTTTPPPATTTRLTDYLNDTQRELLTIPELRRLRDSLTTITAKANTSRSGLPPSVQRIIGITDRTNGIKLRQMTLEDLRLTDPMQAFIGSYPTRYAPVGSAEVQFQPVATGLWAVSSATADTTQTVLIESVTTGGYSYKDTKVLNGQNRVQIGATATRTDHIEVARFYMSAVGVGYVSLYDASAGGNELARIEPGKTFARYLTVEWQPIPTVDTTLYMDFTRTIFDLVNGTDEPLIPDDFHLVVVNGAAMKEYLFANDSRYSALSAEYEKGQRDLMAFVMNDGDRVASLRADGVGRWNRLGPTYDVTPPWWMGN